MTRERSLLRAKVGAVAIGAALAGMTAGCFNLNLSYSPPDQAATAGQVQLTSAGHGRVGAHFTWDKNVFFLLGGLVPIGAVDLSVALAPHVAGGRRIVNLRLHTARMVDLWLFSWAKVTVEGDELAPVVPAQQ